MTNDNRFFPKEKTPPPGLFPLETWLEPLLDKLRLGQRSVSLKGLWGSARALLLAGLHLLQDRPLLVLTASCEESRLLYTDLEFFHGLLAGGASSSKPVYYFPDWEILPYEPISPQPEIMAQRLDVLYKLFTGRGTPLVTAPLTAVMQRLIPRSVLGNTAELLVAGEELERESLLRALCRGGYRTVDMVEQEGEYSRRGGILDIWGPGFDRPVRVEFFGDEVSSLRAFDPHTQRSLGEMDEVIVLPAGEAVLDEENRERLKKRVREKGLEDSLLQEELFQRLDLGEPFSGLEQYIPLLYDKCEFLLDYLPRDTLVVVDEPEYVERRGAQFEVKAAREFQQIGRTPYPAPEEAYLTWDKCKRLLAGRGRINFDSLTVFKDKAPPSLLSYEVKSLDLPAIKLLNRQEKGYLSRVCQCIGDWLGQGCRVVVVCSDEAQARRMQELFFDYELLSDVVFPGQWPRMSGSKEGAGRLLITVGELSAGFRLPREGLLLISERDIFGEPKKKRRLSSRRSSRFLSSLSDLQVGDYVVHVDHGIGRYLGLSKLEMEDRVLDFLLLEYRDKDKLYVPLDRLYLVQKYMSSDSEKRVELHKLGGKKWARQKAGVKKDLLSMADELVKVYAARDVLGGFCFSPDTHWQKEFEASFEYSETPDQRRVIEEVKADMEGEKPMDRLVCGDVGFGKTEVALRAAFKAVMDGKQVLILVPTTILAQQHFNTFSRRLANYPFNVGMFSRFRTPQEKKLILEELKSGAMDIVVGTHSLLQKDIKCAALGLLIIDEEQHFGVRHKEKIKALKSQVDVLTMTATPIPRTLHLALSGLRGLSIIETPPEGRMEIQTTVLPYDNTIIREAVLREMERGGQVFFVHNRVENIEQVADQVRRQVSEARVVVGHGQMSESVLENIMLEFMAGKYDVLVSTTIIESGLDISNANTIIINRADTFGLAQLYQLRGRVGRSAKRAYAYLLIPPGRVLTENARKRLKAIQELSELGAGFRLAAHDLEIRGAGNILGPQQHGHINAVGFDLYCQLMEEAVNEIKGQPQAKATEVLLELNLNARLAEEYIPDTNQRLTMYKRFSTAEDEGELRALRDEMEDRYGRMPPEAELLLEVMALKVRARRLGVAKVQRENGAYRVSFDETTPVSPQKIVSLVQGSPKLMSLTPDNQLVVRQTSKEPARVCAEVAGIFSRLT